MAGTGSEPNRRKGTRIVYLKVIACEVAWREIAFVASHSSNMLDLEFLPVGHHDEPKKGHADLQARIRQTQSGKYDALLVGYGLCSLMLNGLEAHDTRLVIPRAHDCLTLFLGSRRRYQELFDRSPGTYYFTAGWLEFQARRARARGEDRPIEELAFQTSPVSMGKTYADLVARYGEENAKYLLEVAHSWSQSYQQGVLIRFDFDRALGLKEKVDYICQRQGWQTGEVTGNLDLLQRWMNGPWDSDDFVTVQPGEAVYPTYDERIMEARPPGKS
ncbi:MAG: DUF1638 domain-containing protein [Candidatus Omnitrophica bacterium]|nr:DUF1638 domain-containing protein [Candidatus Omnitrophota bacterium]